MGIPVIFHNLKGYFIMQNFGKMIEEERVHDVVRVKKGDNIIEVNKKIDINIIAKKFSKNTCLLG